MTIHSHYEKQVSTSLILSCWSKLQSITILTFPEQPLGFSSLKIGCNSRSSAWGSSRSGLRDKESWSVILTLWIDVIFALIQWLWAAVMTWWHVLTCNHGHEHDRDEKIWITDTKTKRNLSEGVSCGGPAFDPPKDPPGCPQYASLWRYSEHVQQDITRIRKSSLDRWTDSDGYVWNDCNWGWKNSRYTVEDCGELSVRSNINFASSDLLSARFIKRCMGAGIELIWSIGKENIFSFCA